MRLSYEGRQAYISNEVIGNDAAIVTFERFGEGDEAGFWGEVRLVGPAMMDGISHPKSLNG